MSAGLFLYNLGLRGLWPLDPRALWSLNKFGASGLMYRSLKALCRNSRHPVTHGISVSSGLLDVLVASLDIEELEETVSSMMEKNQNMLPKGHQKGLFVRIVKKKVTAVR